MSTEEKKGVIILYKYEEPLSMLPPEEQAKILMASIAYDQRNEVPEFDNPVTKMLFALMKQDFDIMRENWNKTKVKNRERAKAGASKRWNKEADESIDENAKNANSIPSIDNNANDALYDNDYDSDSEYDCDNDNATTPKSPAGESKDAAKPLEAEAAVDESAENAEKVPYKRIMELYNSICAKLPKIQKIDGERRKAVSARYKSYNNDLIVFKSLFEKAESSAFMTGGGKKNWVADFDFLMTADGMAKTLEGKYDNKINTGTVQKSDGIDHELLAKTQELERKYAEEASKNPNRESGVLDW